MRCEGVAGSELTRESGNGDELNKETARSKWKVFYNFVI